MQKDIMAKCKGESTNQPFRIWNELKVELESGQEGSNLSSPPIF